MSQQTRPKSVWEGRAIIAEAKLAASDDARARLEQALRTVREVLIALSIDWRTKAYLEQIITEAIPVPDTGAEPFHHDAIAVVLDRAADIIDALRAQLQASEAARDEAMQQVEVLKPGGRYAWKVRAEQAEAALCASEDERTRLIDVCNESNAVCVCGCPEADHENYGDEGESCENETHQCFRTSKAVAAKLKASEDARDEAREAAQFYNKRAADAKVLQLHAEAKLKASEDARARLEREMAEMTRVANFFEKQKLEAEAALRASDRDDG